MHLGLLYSLATLSLPLTRPVLAAKPKEAILLSDVQSLTLYGNRKTTHRRVPAVPQLRCVSAKSICSLHQVDVMRCVNQGSRYGAEDIQWACKAELPSTLKLGSTEVICEGYASPDDPYVLKGSCAVEYRMSLTDEGERRHPAVGGPVENDKSLPAWLFGVVFVAVALWIVASACSAAWQNGAGPPRRRRTGWGGGGGWGGWGGGGGGGGGGPGGWNDPPPPYPGTKPADGQGWRPGFWSGLAGGAAAGYMAGRRNQENSPLRRQSGWGGYTDDSNTRASGSGSGRWGSGSSSSASSSRHESTGFGSTSRR